MLEGTIPSRHDIPDGETCILERLGTNQQRSPFATLRSLAADRAIADLRQLTALWAPYLVTE
jgi:hypothetical protein